MAHYTKTPFDIDNTAFVNVVVDTYCNHVVVYEDARAATSDILVKGNVGTPGEIQKVAGEKIDFRSKLYSPGQIAGSIKAVSAVTVSMAQEEDTER